jgi:hypothetical protein
MYYNLHLIISQHLSIEHVHGVFPSALARVLIVVKNRPFIVRVLHPVYWQKTRQCPKP